MPDIARVTVVGAGLAGCEAAWQLISRGVPVTICEMRPDKLTPAHSGGGFAELVCSNSLKAEHLTSASGLLKAEMARFDSLILRAAGAARVPAGGALAVDRDAFSVYITDALRSHPLCTIELGVVGKIPEGEVIIATGPLTDATLAGEIMKLDGMAPLNFFDAAAPIITAESIDSDKTFRTSRYGKGGDDYINCPMTEAEYGAFYDALTGAELAEVHGFEKNLVYEGCLAVEILASRGRDTLRFGPMKPVGLIDPHTGRMPYAVVQLRQDNAQGTLYNMVGFQTRLKWGEQKRVFSMIPGLERAEFARYGVMHRNTYIDAPSVLGENYVYRRDPRISFAGQISGVEGYMESAASGLVAGIAKAARIVGMEPPVFTGRTMLGALMRYTIADNRNYQPMNANFGLLTPLLERVKGKRNRYEKLAERAICEIDEMSRKITEG